MFEDKSFHLCNQVNSQLIFFVCLFALGGFWTVFPIAIGGTTVDPLKHTTVMTTGRTLFMWVFNSFFFVSKVFDKWEPNPKILLLT